MYNYVSPYGWMSYFESMFYKRYPYYTIRKNIIISKEDIRLYFNQVADFSKYFKLIPFKDNNVIKSIIEEKIKKVNKILKKEKYGFELSDFCKIRLYKYTFASVDLLQKIFIIYYKKGCLPWDMVLL